MGSGKVELLPVSDKRSERWKGTNPRRSRDSAPGIDG